MAICEGNLAPPPLVILGFEVALTRIATQRLMRPDSGIRSLSL